MTVPATSAPHRATDTRAFDDVSRAHARIAALEQLLEVYEQASLEQAARQEQSLRERESLLERERMAARELTNSEERLRLALTAGRMGTWEWDIAGSRVIWSPEEEALYGLAPGAFTGSIAEYESRIHPDDRASAFAAVQAALAASAPTHHVLHRIVRSDGQVRWLDSHARFVYAADGAPVRLVGVSTDVTDARRAEEAMAQREAEFRTLANSIPQLAWMTDGTGAIEWYNQRWFDYTGTRFEDMRGWGWASVHHPDHLDRVKQKFTDAVAKGAEWEDTFPLRRADGEWRWFLSRALPIRSADGTVSRWFGTNTDITERLEIEASRDRALADLQVERARLYEVFMQAPAAIAILEGPEHRFTVANQLYRALIGGRMIDHLSVREALPELEGQGFYELLDQVYATGEPFVAHELPVSLDRDGDGIAESLYVDFVYQPLTQSNGAVFGIMVHAVESTDRVEARRRLETFAMERSAILSQIADVVVTTDADGRITFYNGAAIALYGDMVSGVPIWDDAQPFTLLGADGVRRAPADVPLARALRNERVTDEEWSVRRGDGTVVVVRGSAVPLRTPTDELMGGVMTVRDVTAERALQRQVEHERARLQEVLMQAPAAISVTEGPDHVVVMQNAVSRQLIGGRDLVGLRTRDVFPDADGQEFVTLQDTVYQTGEPFIGKEMYIQIAAPDGGAAVDGYFNFVYHPLRDVRGDVYGILSHAVDVTDQVRARQLIEQKASELSRLSQALTQSNRELDQFAYVASHDLKAPLRGIANLTEWLAEDLGDRVTGESRNHMELLKGRVHRMEALIDGILDYSRAGRVREAVESVSVSSFLADLIELLAPGPEVEIIVEEPMPVLMTERIPLQQVLMNLVGNAIKYRGEAAPRIVIRCEDAADMVQFSISDNGPGIPEQFHDRIWQIFQTLAPRDRVEGTGIGLSVVRKLVETRGGRVWLESDVGVGTTFSFTWPKETMVTE